MKTFRRVVGIPIVVVAGLLPAACRTIASSSSQVAGDEGPTESAYVPEFLTQVYDGASPSASVFAAAGSASTEDEGGTYAAPIPDGSYAVIFAYQGSFLNAPRNSHSFASIFKVRTDSDGRKIMSDSHTLSWLPVDGQLTILENVAEWGRNYTLTETLGSATAANRIIRHSGFWRIEDNLFEALKARKLYLDRGGRGGSVSYKVNPNMDDRQRVLAWAYEMSGSPGATNCIHAISDAIRRPGDELLDTGMRHGFAASDMIFDSFAPWRREALSALPSNTMIAALKAFEAQGEIVIQAAPSDDETPAARVVSTFRYIGGQQPVQIPVAGFPFVRDVIVGKTGQCGPSGSFYALVRVGPGVAGGAATIQDPADPSLWHPNGGQGRQVNLIDLTLRSQYQLDCTVTVSIR